jgi:hypothetical protein
MNKRIRTILTIVFALSALLTQASACDNRGDESMRSDNTPSQMWDWVNQFAE